MNIEYETPHKPFNPGLCILCDADPRHILAWKAKHNSLFYLHYSVMPNVHYKQKSTFRMWRPLWQGIPKWWLTVKARMGKMQVPPRGRTKQLPQRQMEGHALSHGMDRQTLHSSGDASHTAFMWTVSSGEAQFQKTLWMGYPEQINLPLTRAEFKDNNTLLERDSPSYLYFYFKPTCFKSGLEPHFP